MGRERERERARAWKRERECACTCTCEPVLKETQRHTYTPPPSAAGSKHTTKPDTAVTAVVKPGRTKRAPKAAKTASKKAK